MAEEKKDGDDLDIADTVGPAANYAEGAVQVFPSQEAHAFLTSRTSSIKWPSCFCFAPFHILLLLFLRSYGYSGNDGGRLYRLQ